MSQLSNANLTIILDKLARFAVETIGDQEFDNSFTAGMELASDNVWGPLATMILALNDEDQVADLLPAARVLDETHPTLADGTLLLVPSINNMIKALDTHYKFYGYKGVNDYMTQQNAATPTIRAHGFFRRYLKTLDPGNVFIPADLDLVTFAETGATAGTLTQVATIDKTKYAGAKLVVVNVGALTTSAVLSVTATKLDGTSAVLTATLSTHTDAHATDLSDTTKKYIGVTAISITTGTNADAFKIVAKTDRSIASA